MKAKKHKVKSIVKIRYKKIKGGNLSIYLDIYNNGKRSYEFLKLYIKDNPRSPIERNQNQENLELAEKIRTKKENEIKSAEYGITQKNNSKVNFFVFFQKYIDDYQNKDKRLVQAAYNQFKAFVGKEHLYASEITETMLKKFKKHLENKFNGETPHNYFKKLKKVLKQAHKERLMQFNPAEDIVNTRSEEGLKKDVLTFEEIELLYSTECGNQEVKRAFLFCLNTGLRFCDIKVLKWKDIKNDRIELKQSKTKKTVFIDLNKNAKALLGDRESSINLIFKLPTLNGANKVLKNWLGKVEIEKHITWHCARHSFGVNLVRMNAHMKTISGLLGHTSTRQTEIYTRYVDELKKEAVDSLPDLFIS